MPKRRYANDAEKLHFYRKRRKLGRASTFAPDCGPEDLSGRPVPPTKVIRVHVDEVLWSMVSQLAEHYGRSRRHVYTVAINNGAARARQQGLDPQSLFKDLRGTRWLPTKALYENHPKQLELEEATLDRFNSLSEGLPRHIAFREILIHLLEQYGLPARQEAKPLEHLKRSA